MSPSEYRSNVSASAVLLLVVIALNSLLLAEAWNDQSWIALGIAIFYGPAVNAAVAVGSVVTGVILRRRLPQFSIAWHACLSLVLPTMATAIDFFAIMCVDLHGC